jgi:CSLREA domain-containing protein
MSMKTLVSWRRSALSGAVTVAMVSTVVVSSASTAGATVFTVNRFDDPAPDGCTTDPDGCSLREAIIDANVDPGPDDITLPAGTYVLTRSGNGEANGDLNISNPLTITGAGANTTTIDSDVAGDRVLSNDAVASISGVTITGGTRDPGGGGGIDSSAPLTLSSVAVTGNQSAGGGAGISVSSDCLAAARPVARSAYLGQNPKERHLSSILLMGDDVCLDRVEARLLEQAPVGGSIEPAEEHRHSKPVVFDRAGVIA